MPRWLDTLLFPVRRFRRGPDQAHVGVPGSSPWTRIASLDERQEYARSMAREYDRRIAHEARLLENAQEAFAIPGYCVACSEQTALHVDYAHCFISADGTRTPNWRERLVCPGCGLNNRMRASIHFFLDQCTPTPRSPLYITEQTTPLFHWLRKRFPNTIGSEFLGDHLSPGQHVRDDLRHEDLTGLSFPDAQFDAVLSFDVFEHIPDYRQALRECRRVIKPGGRLLFTVPFDLAAQTHTVRAAIAPDGSLEHYLPPEYHGDPLSSDGCLCFRHFGWDILDELQNIGFTKSDIFFYWSHEFGYLGIEQFIILAHA